MGRPFQRIKYNDLEYHVLRKPRLEFLHDHVWAFKPKAGSVTCHAQLYTRG